MVRVRERGQEYFTFRQSIAELYLRDLVASRREWTSQSGAGNIERTKVNDRFATNLQT